MCNFERNCKDRGIFKRLAIGNRLLIIKGCMRGDIFGKGEQLSKIIREWKSAVDREGFFFSCTYLLPTIHPDVVFKAKFCDALGCSGVLKLQRASESLGELVSTEMAGPLPESLNHRSSVGPRLCIHERVPRWCWYFWLDNEQNISETPKVWVWEMRYWYHSVEWSCATLCPASNPNYVHLKEPLGVVGDPKMAERQSPR